MSTPKTIVAFSGGKDSTAMAYMMHQEGEEFALLHTPTGNELPGVREHVEETAARLGVELIIPKGPSLDDVIRFHKALPNFRMRFCTTQIKIQPCIAWLKRHPGSTLCVGLRDDEEEREGLYGPYAEYRYPLREWGWGLEEVVECVNQLDTTIPPRTDCALCPYQRLGQWRELLRNYPEEYAKGIAYEKLTGHTFRSPGRDQWPAALKDLAREFESGRKIRGEDKEKQAEACRVCRL